MTEWAAKNSVVARRRVCSQAVAFAPFSQYSKARGLAGFAQAQDVHMMPPGLFCLVSSAVPVTGTPSG